MNRYIFIIFVSLLIFIGFIFFFHKSEKIIGVEIGRKVFFVIIRDTEKGRENGLSFWADLADNQGMLFIFSTPDKYGFWMKDMTFPIDIIWIDENMKIIHIEKSVLPETYPKVFYPETESLYVLEVSAGQSDVLDLRVGDGVKMIKK